MRNRSSSRGGNIVRSKLYAPLRRWLALATLLSLAAPWAVVRVSGAKGGATMPVAIAFSGVILVAILGLLRSVLRADARMRALIDSSLDLVMIVDVAGGVRYHSPGMSHMLGFETGVQAGTPVTHLLHPDDASLMEESFRRIRTDGSVKPIECRWRHADGSERWLETVFNN